MMMIVYVMALVGGIWTMILDMVLVRA
jgi:hypothetical protein